MNSQRKAVTPAARPIFASGMFCSSTREAISLRVSSEHEEGGIGFSKFGKASLILATGQENSNDTSTALSHLGSSLLANIMFEVSLLNIVASS